MRRLSRFLPHFWTLVLSLAVLAVLFLHQWNLGESPRGLFSDEASIGLNAYTMARYGTDEFGTATPLYFEAFGEYKNPVYIYALAGVLRFFPLSDVTVRGMSFLFFTGILVLWMILAHLLWKRRSILLFQILLLGLTPWLFTLSRVSFEAISFVFFYISFIICIFCLYKNKKYNLYSVFLFSVLSVIFAGLAWYSYSTARLLIPWSVLSACILLLRRHPWYLPLGILGGFGLTLLPAYSLLSSGETVLLGRFEQISYLFDPGRTAWETLRQFAQTYISYFSPDFHLWRGDMNLRHHAGPAGMASYLLYAGMWWGLGRTLVPGGKATNFDRWMMLELFMAPVAASLTEPGHAIRVISMIVPMLYFAGNALGHLSTLAGEWKRPLGILLLGVLLLEASFFFPYALGAYTQHSVRHFMTFGTEEAVRTAHGQGYPLLVIDRNLYEANVIASYYTEVLENQITITSGISELNIQDIKSPFCYLAKHRAYTSPRELPRQDGIAVPLDVRSSLRLTCFPKKA